MSRLPLLAAALSLLVGACTFGGATGTGSAAEESLLDRPMVDVATSERFTLRQLAAERPVLLETMAVWCTTCLRQQHEVVRAHQMADFLSVGIGVDPNEPPEVLARYAAREGFDWRFVDADAELVQLLRDAFGVAATNPPSTPTFIVTGEGIRALPFGQVRGARDLLAELGV